MILGLNEGVTIYFLINPKPKRPPGRTFIMNSTGREELPNPKDQSYEQGGRSNSRIPKRKGTPGPEAWHLRENKVSSRVLDFETVCTRPTPNLNVATKNVESDINLKEHKI